MSTTKGRSPSAQERHAARQAAFQKREEQRVADELARVERSKRMSQSQKRREAARIIAQASGLVHGVGE